VNELYEGELAIKAKESARKMATGQYLTIWNNRPANKKSS
jgi:hemoglobin